MDNKNEKINLLYIGSAPDTLSLFEQSGFFSIKQKDNSISALNYLQKFDKIDAIVSEVHLPGTNGINTFKLLQSYKITDNLPFVLMAHQNEPEYFDKAFNAGLDDFYVNPINITRIYERIRFLIQYKEQIPRHNSEPVQPYTTPKIKRIFDVVVAGMALILLSPLMAMVMAAIKIESDRKSVV